MKIVLDYIGFIIYSVFLVYIMNRMIRMFLYKSDNYIHRQLWLSIICIAVMILQSVFAPEFIINIITSLTIIFILTFSYKCSMVKRFLVTICIYSSLNIAEIIVAGAASIGKFAVSSDKHNGNAMMYLCLCVVLWFISEIIRKCTSKNHDTGVSKGFIVFVIGASIFILLFQAVLFLYPVKKYGKMVFGIFALFTMFVIMYLYDSLSKAFHEKRKTERMEWEKNYYYNQAKLLNQKNKEISQGAPTKTGYLQPYINRL